MAKNVVIGIMAMLLAGQAFIITNTTARLGAMNQVLTDQIHNNISLSNELFQCEALGGNIR